MICGAPTTRASSCSPIERYCYPLTISDFASRYLLTCEALATTKESLRLHRVRAGFQGIRLAQAIRTDNGVPFASAHALFGLSKLSVWWLRLGIRIERIKPGHPEQNGRHERMHLTLKKEATKPAAQNFLQQQAKFDDFIDCYNRERPHQALGMKYPAELYEPSPRPYRGLGRARVSVPRPNHHRHPLRPDLLRRHKINLSRSSPAKTSASRRSSDKIWLVTFMHYDLGFFDHETCRLETADNPFEPKVLPMSPV